MSLDILHINEEILEHNSKIISESFRENNAANWFAGACAAAITDDPILGATFYSYYGDEYTSKISDEIDN